MKIDNFFAELKRRNVYKVAVAYAVVGWLLIQVTTQVFPIFEIPNWALRLIVLGIIIGFPIALVLAWAMRPENMPMPPGDACDALPSGGVAIRPRVSMGLIVTLDRTAAFTVARSCAMLSAPLSRRPLPR